MPTPSSDDNALADSVGDPSLSVSASWLLAALAVASVGLSAALLDAEPLGAWWGLVGTALGVVVIALGVLDGWQRAMALFAVGAILSTRAGQALLGHSAPLGAVALLPLVLWAWLDRRSLRVHALPRSFVFGGVLVVVWTVASVSWSRAPESTAMQALGATAVFVAVAGTLRHRWTSLDRINGDIAAIYGICAAVLTACLILYLVGLEAPTPDLASGPRDNTEISTRLRGVFPNPNTAGLVASLAIPLGVGLCLDRRRLRPVLMLSVGVCVTVLALSGSRTALVAALAGVTVLVIRSGRRGRVLLALLGALAVVVVLSTQAIAWFADAYRLGVLDGATDAMTSDRIYAWRASIDAWLERPFLGHGFGSGPDVFSQLRTYGTLQFRGGSSHQGYLQLLLELGVVGVVAVGAALCGALGRNSNLRSPLVVGCYGAVVGVLAAQLGESSMLGVSSLHGTFFWFLAAALAASRAAPRHAPDPSTEIEG